MNTLPPATTAAAAPFALLEEEGRARLFSGLAATVAIRGPDDLDRALSGNPDASLADASLAPWAVFALDYEFGHALEPALAAHRDPQAALGRVWRFRDCRTLAAAEVDAWLDGAAARQAGAMPGPVGIAEPEAGLTGEDYRCAVERIRRYIADGDCYQVNFTFPLRFSWFGHPVALYAALRRQQPPRHGGLLYLPGTTVLSLSPELFVVRAGSRLVCRPMKGTAPRGTTPAEDAAQRAGLQASPKDRAENVMIVDLLRNDLGRVAPAGGVRVDELFTVEAYPTLFQLTSTVSAEAPGVSPATALRTLFPCGSITGAPKVRAMQIIAELETVPRGLYTGTVGYAGPGNAFSANVAIRTLVLDANGQGTMGIGSGIVADSSADREYEECLLKASFLIRRDPGFRLIETLRLVDGDYPLIERHLARLARSARAFGFACDLPAVRAALLATAARTVSGDATRDPAARTPRMTRVRLTLAHSGAIDLADSPLDDGGAPADGWLTRWSAEPLRADDVLLRHKTTARQRYDRALARLAGDPGMFDTIFCNERGEVCEGARSNVFARIDGLLRTPPLSCGLLPGVLREELIATGQAVEAVLYPADLRRAEALYLGNAVRGLIAVRLIESAAGAPPAASAA